MNMHSPRASSTPVQWSSFPGTAGLPVQYAYILIRGRGWVTNSHRATQRRSSGGASQQKKSVAPMSPETPDPAPRWSLPVKQDRAQKTRDRLLAAGFKLLRRKHFDELSVADIARSAGCAVGSFYLRFVDKDQYF